MGSNPNLVTGQEPTASDWNGYFGVKADDLVFAGDVGTGGTRGLVPPPPAGSAAAHFVLQASGVWGPAGGGGSAWGQLVSYVTPLTGDVVTMSPPGGAIALQALVIEPAGELATLTVHLPTSVLDQLLIEISSTAVIDSLLVASTDGSTVLSPTTRIMTVGSGVGLRYRASNTTWYWRY